MNNETESRIGLQGLLIASIVLPEEEMDAARIVGMDIVRRDPGFIEGHRHNTFVNTGLNIALDRLFGLGTPPAAPTGIAVSSDDQAITGATTLLDIAGGDTGFVRKAFDATPIRTNQTVACLATFTQADVSFAMNKVGILNTTTDAGTGLLNVIGGTGNSPFTIDLTGVTTWSLTFTIQITASAT